MTITDDTPDATVVPITRPKVKTPDRCHTCARHATLGFPHPCAGSPCRHCPWPACNCTHGGGCDRGWIEDRPLSDGYAPAVVRCPQCAMAAADAQLLISAGK